MRSHPAPIVIIVDSREQTPFPFPDTVRVSGREVPVKTRVQALKTGDYSIDGLVGVAAVERKGPGDFLSSISHDRARFDKELDRLALHRYAAIVVEAHLDDLRDASGVRTKAILGSVASFYARYRVPTFFVGQAVFGADITLGLLRRWQSEERKRQSMLRFQRKGRAA